MACRFHRGRTLAVRELWIPQNLPYVPIGVLEIARIPTPECLSGGLDNPGAGALGLFHHRVDLFRATDVMTDSELGRTRWLARESGVAGDAGPRPQSEDQTIL